MSIDWARKGAGFTWLFEAQVMRLMKEMPVNAVAREVGEHDTRLWRVFHYYVQKGMDACDISHVERVAIDETSSKRGHQYVTLFVDLETKRVLLAVEGKGAEGLRSFKDFLKEKGVEPSQIKEVCCDMSPAFISGIEEHFSQAQITFDKFHVLKMVNGAVDRVRRSEAAHQSNLKKTRYIWLKNPENLTEYQREQLKKLSDADLKTGRAYRIKLSLQRFWLQNEYYAPLYLEDWCNWAVRSKLQPIKDVAKTIRRHAQGILRWFVSKMTNGFLEGVNSLIQASKRKARGYRSIRNYVSMIYATVNKLDIKVEPPRAK
ncbi:ISL3 family transposase [Terrilactibacillus sp. S3-3]|nr:ISL3 family transposase [Terrilactibacillus sp. S3-3]